MDFHDLHKRFTAPTQTTAVRPAAVVAEDAQQIAGIFYLDVKRNVRKHAPADA